MSDLITRCAYFLPDTQDEEDLSGWVSRWSPQIVEDRDAAKALMSILLTEQDPEVFPYLALLQACLEDANFTGTNDQATYDRFVKALNDIVAGTGASLDVIPGRIKQIAEIYKSAGVTFPNQSG